MVHISDDRLKISCHLVTVEDFKDVLANGHQ